MLTTRDVTERRQLEEQLTDQAFHDSLTGLPNRALFGDRLEHAVARSTRIGDPIAVLFIDLDDFKAVNDTLGHREGDELLRHVATELALCVRRSDTVARLGGDEFAVLMEDATVTEALEAADRIQQRLRYPVMVQGSEIVVSASVGIAATDEHVGESAELMRNADIAMYCAKTDGKARYKLFEADMHSQVVERTALITDLRPRSSAARWRSTTSRSSSSRRSSRGLRGPRPLASLRAGHDRPDRVHQPRRADRPHRAHRRVRARSRVPPARGVGRRRHRLGALLGERQRVRSPARGARSGRDGRARPADDRSRTRRD